jgi:hypothetical protein
MKTEIFANGNTDQTPKTNENAGLNNFYIQSAINM